MACVQALYLVVDLLHSGEIPGLTFGLICGAGMEPRTLYILAVLFHWATTQPCGTTKLFSSQNPLHAEWYRHEGKVCEKIVLFSHLCGEAVWELEPEPPAWAAQVLCREQGWRKVLLLSKASARTLSLLLPFPLPLNYWSSEFKSYPEHGAENDAPSTGLLGLP